MQNDSDFEKDEPELKKKDDSDFDDPDVYISDDEEQFALQPSTKRIRQIIKDYNRELQEYFLNEYGSLDTLGYKGKKVNPGLYYPFNTGWRDKELRSASYEISGRILNWLHLVHLIKLKNFLEDPSKEKTDELIGENIYDVLYSFAQENDAAATEVAIDIDPTARSYILEYRQLQNIAKESDDYIHDLYNNLLSTGRISSESLRFFNELAPFLLEKDALSLKDEEKHFLVFRDMLRIVADNWARFANYIEKHIHYLAPNRRGYSALAFTSIFEPDFKREENAVKITNEAMLILSSLFAQLKPKRDENGYFVFKKLPKEILLSVSSKKRAPSYHKGVGTADSSDLEPGTYEKLRDGRVQINIPSYSTKTSVNNIISSAELFGLNDSEYTDHGDYISLKRKKYLKPEDIAKLLIDVEKKKPLFHYHPTEDTYIAQPPNRRLAPYQYADGADSVAMDFSPTLSFSAVLQAQPVFCDIFNNIAKNSDIPVVFANILPANPKESDNITEFLYSSKYKRLLVRAHFLRHSVCLLFDKIPGEEKLNAYLYDDNARNAYGLSHKRYLRGMLDPNGNHMYEVDEAAEEVYMTSDGLNEKIVEPYRINAVERKNKKQEDIFHQLLGKIKNDRIHIITAPYPSFQDIMLPNSSSRYSIGDCVQFSFYFMLWYGIIGVTEVGGELVLPSPTIIPPIIPMASIKRALTLLYKYRGIISELIGLGRIKKK